ncbi:MAG TPA: hypothetical protein VMT50_01535, partial [Steroidobacteraceae bacterium]|nr:hypothetical protein [Steroidobacteraceae bacterium]
NIGLAAWYNAAMLYRGLRKAHVLHHAPGWRQMWVQVVAGNVVLGLFLWFVAGDTAQWIGMHMLKRVAWMSLLVAGGAALYFATLFLFGMRVSHLRVRSVGPIPPRPQVPAA